MLVGETKLKFGWKIERKFFKILMKRVKILSSKFTHSDLIENLLQEIIVRVG